MRRSLLGYGFIALAVVLMADAAVQAHQRGWPGKRLSQAFPEAARFTSRQLTLSADQIGRVEQAIGERVEAENRAPTFFPAFDQAGAKIGFVLFVDQAGENGAIELSVAVGADGKVRHAVIASSREDKRIAQPAFLDQFTGKTAGDPLKVGADVTAVAGAEKASQAVAVGVRKALWLAREAFGAGLP